MARSTSAQDSAEGSTGSTTRGGGRRQISRRRYHHRELPPLDLRTPSGRQLPY